MRKKCNFCCPLYDDVADNNNKNRKIRFEPPHDKTKKTANFIVLMVCEWVNVPDVVVVVYIVCADAKVFVIQLIVAVRSIVATLLCAIKIKLIWPNLYCVFVVAAAIVAVCGSEFVLLSALRHRTNIVMVIVLGFDPNANWLSSSDMSCECVSE